MLLCCRIVSYHLLCVSLAISFMLNTIHLFHMHYLETLQRNEGNRSHIPENRLGLDGTEKWGRIGFLHAANCVQSFISPIERYHALIPAVYFSEDMYMMSGGVLRAAIPQNTHPSVSLFTTK